MTEVAVADEARPLTTAEAARRLGVKPATLYSYVSRGLLSSTPAGGRRGSLFSAREVERLAGRRRTGGRASASALDRIATRLTLLEDDAMYYRGVDVTGLARHRSAEAVAHLLWTGDLDDPAPFAAPAELVALARGAAGALPGAARTTDRLRVAVNALGAADPLRFNLSPDAVVHTGRTLLGVAVDALSPAAPRGDGPLAERLWPALAGPAPAGPARLLDAALVLLADHDLAASTMAARVAASARAHPYAVVSAGLGALDGHTHGVAPTLAHRFLTDALDDPVACLSEQLRLGRTPPGFGHRVYRARDPRADTLFAMLREEPAAAQVLEAVDVVTRELRRGTDTFPNVDLALAALAHTFGMRPDAGEVVFAVARTVGWIAHAIEEYEEPALRLRLAGVYVGDRPPPSAAARDSR